MEIDAIVEAAAALKEGNQSEHQCEPEKEASQTMLQEQWRRTRQHQRGNVTSIPRYV